jgi:hypothetical protein
MLVVLFSQSLSNEARAVLAGVICALGVMVTTVTLVVFVRQYHEDR